MASRLTVIFYIVLCMEAGFFLTVLPWVQWFGMGDWGDNFFLVYAAQKTGFVGLQRAVGSGWVRGAVTGLGLLNFAMAFWEIFHFREAVQRLQGLDSRAAEPRQETLPTNTTTTTPADAAPKAATTPDISHHERRDDS